MSKEKAIGRRAALKVAAGSAAAAALGISPSFQEQIRGRVNEVLDFVMSQRFLDDLKAVLDSPRDMQLEEAAKRFDPRRLEKIGIKPPKGTRISSRVFDEDSKGSRILGAPRSPIGVDLRVPKETLKVRDIQALIDKNRLVTGTKDWGVCLCVGTGVCVGVGGSS